ncbi:MAG: heme d1 biosynthesis radical SAM protein NirJ [Rhodocyclales bacterium]|nr:heme d1 biosynthesis radical SAM protein NirJ [Rhodocyclales bacterium]
MFRLSAFVDELFSPTPIGPRRRSPGPVVIWNLIRRCNLACEHCYSLSADADFAGELSTAEALAVIDDLARFRVPALILSGGEPLLRPDLSTLAAHAKAQGMYVALSTNGTLIDEAMLDRIAAAEFDYVGISLDGLEATHDRFRRHAGAFAASARAVRGAVSRGLKVGVRFTLTEGNAADLVPLLDWVRAENVPRFYLSHLNYAGRGRKNRAQDAAVQTTRWALETLFERCLQEWQEGAKREYTTGNQDADGAFFLLWVRRRFPERTAHIEAKLRQWGGNASGVNVANIDNLGKVHPDTMWWHLRLGDVRERPFSAIWSDPDDALLARLRQHPRQLEGRCARCRFLDLCNGSSRVRAKIGAGSPWAEDPGCYLYDEEIAA